MAKKKVKKAASAKAEPVSAKDRLKNASAALTAFLKENKLARDEDHSKNKKHGAKYKELTLEVEKATAALEEGTPKTKPAKEAKGAAADKKKAAAGRGTIYEYPEGLTAAEKKEFRVKARKAAKAASKGDAPAKAKKEAPKADKAKGGKKEVAKVETKDIKKKKKVKSKND